MIYCFLMGAVVSAYSQTESELDPIIVSATLSPERLSKTGRNLIVIKGEKFAELPVHSVDELLRYIPGAEVQMRGPFGSQSDIIIRGGTFQQVLVVLDGVRLNDPNTGHFSSYIPIAPAEIERIEVMKGASSAIYGSEAVGGVIHIITKSFAARAGEKRKQGLVQLTAGEYGLLSANAGGTISNGTTTFSGGVLSNNTTGQLQRGIRGYVHAHTISASLASKISENFSLAFRAAYDDRDFAAQNFYTTFTSDTSNERVKTFWNQLELQHNAKNNVLKFSAGYKNLNDYFKFNRASAANESKSELLQALLTDDWKISSHTALITGLQYINKGISSNDRGDHNVNQGALFAVLNQQAFERLFLSPALRLDWNEIGGWELVPQLNASFRTTNFQLRASAGKTIRDADFTERFNNYNKTLVTSGRMGNPWLVAERSFSYEMGADAFLSNSMKISATYFDRRHKNLIDYVITPYSQMPRIVNLSPTGTYALAKNIATVNTAGIEADLQYTTSFRNNQSLWATLGLTKINSESSNAVPSFYVSSHARYLVNFNFIYSNKFLNIAANGIYKNRAPQAATAAIAKVNSDYFVMNLKTEAVLVPRFLNLFVEVDNIFNVRYADLLGAQMPARWLMGGIRLTLSK